MMSNIFNRIIGLFLSRQCGQPRQTAPKLDDVDLGESHHPQCRKCGSNRLLPDHGGYYYDSVDRFGRLLCCVDCDLVESR